MATVNYNFPLDPNGHSESELITALYLYGDKVTVDQNGNVVIPKDEELLESSLIREELVVPQGATNQTQLNIDIIEAQVDAVDYMTTGAGRFANGYQFDLVKAFFGETANDMNTDGGRANYLFSSAELNRLGNTVTQGGITSRIYNKDDIDKIYFQDQLSATGFSANLELRNYDDGNDNLNQRIYVWNSQQYSIPDSVEFVINYDAAGNEIGREIIDFKIEPNVRTLLDFKENFDFDTANPFVEIGSGRILEPRVDPSGIGRTVYFDFDNRNSLPLYDPITNNNSSSATYNIDDFNSDRNKENRIFSPQLFSVIDLVVAESEEIFNAGINKFLYKEKPIFYGTVGNDNLNASNVDTSSFPLQIDKVRNGVVLLGGEGNDSLAGDPVFLGNADDILVGHEGNDSLNGKGGEDLAIFSGSFADYDVTPSTDKKTITIDHARGTQADGQDTLRNIEFAQFQDKKQPLSSNAPTPAQSAAAPNQPETVTRIVPLPLEDGVEVTEVVRAASTAANPNPNDPPTPPHVSLTAPVAMLDGDIDFTLNISPYEPDIRHNVFYIIDTSVSIDSAELRTIKDAYIDLTNYYVDAGLAENINFGVVSFDTGGRFHAVSGGDKDLSADEAVAVINGLTTDSGIGTNYDEGLWQGFNWLSQSSYRPSFSTNPDGATSIGYFFSDGQNSSDRFTMLNTARTLRRFANVQAFGFDPTDAFPLMERDINWIDSNQGVMFDDIGNFSTELQKSGLADNVESVNILLDGQIVETLTPDQFTDSPLGLTYSGTVEDESAIEDLDVSIDAENVITAEVVFTPESNFATTAVEHTVTAGESEAVDENGNPIDQSGNNSDNDNPFERQLNGSDGNDEIILGYADRGANGGAGGDEIIGNNRDNTLNGGAGNDRIYAHGGNDTITTGEGIDLVDAGEGIDTVVYSDVTYQNNNDIFLRQSGNVVNYNNTDTITNAEYIQFADVKLSAETLEIVPELNITNDTVLEGSSDSYTLELNVPAPEEVTFNYSTVDGEAIAGDDYTAKSGTITIPAGSTTAQLQIETLIDRLYDEATESLNLNITGLSGAIFSDNSTESVIPVYIENKGRDEPKFLSGGVGNNLLNGGTGNDSILGNDGNDTLNGRDGDDTLKGGQGNDKLYGQNEADDLSGQGGNDTLNGGGGYDRITEFGNVDYKLTNTQQLNL